MGIRAIYASKPLGLWLVLLEKTGGAAIMATLTALTAYFLAQGVHNPIHFVFAGELREDPHDLMATWLLRQFPFLSTRRLVTLEIVWCAWTILLGAEAIGLLLANLWAEWLILLETGFFIPWEILEIARRPTAFKGTILLVNLAILIYLAWRRVRRTASS